MTDTAADVQQRIDDLRNIQEENKIELKADESRNLDADLASTISESPGNGMLTPTALIFPASNKTLPASMYGCCTCG